MTTRQVADLRTNFSVTGLDDVAKATSAVASKSRDAFEKASDAAGKSGAKVVAAAKASQDAVARLAESKAKRDLDKAKGGGDQVAKVALERSIQAQETAAEKARASVREQAEAAVKQQEAAHRLGVEGAVKRATESEANGADPKVARQQLADYIRLQDEELDRVRRITAAVLEQSTAQDAATAKAISAANDLRLAEVAGTEQHRKAERARLYGERGLGRVRHVLAGVVRDFKASEDAGVRAFKHVASQAGRVVRHVGHLVVAGPKAAAALAWKGTLGVLHKVEHVLSSIVHRLVDIAKKAAVVGLAAYGLKKVGDFRQVRDGQALARERSGEAMEQADKTNLAGADRYGRRESSVERVQGIASLAKGLGLDPTGVQGAFGALSESIHEAASSFDKSTGEYNSEQGKLLRSLNVRAVDAQGRERRTEDIMRDVSAQLGRMPAATRQLIVDKLFAGNPEAIKLLTAMNANRNLATYGMERAQRLGTLLTKEDVAGIEVFKRDVTDLRDAWEGVRLAIGRRVIPILDELARKGTAFLVAYRSNIANVVGVQFQRFVANAVTAAAVIEREFHAVERMVDAGERYLRTGQNWVLVGYRAYLAYVKPMFPWVAQEFRKLRADATAFGHAFRQAWAGVAPDRFAWLVTAVDVMKVAGVAARSLAYVVTDLYHAFRGDGGARHYAWVDGFVRKVKGAGKVVRTAMADVWAALRGDAQGVSGDDKVLRWLAERRNAIVAYLKQSVKDVAEIFDNGVTSDKLETWAGRTVNDIAWFVKSLPQWFAKAKEEIDAGRKWIEDAFAEVMKAIGNGPGARGQSERWPWITSLLEGMDTVVDRVSTLIGWFDQLFSAVNKVAGPILGFFGTDLSTLLLFVTFTRFVGKMVGLGTVMDVLAVKFAKWAGKAAIAGAVTAVEGLIKAVRSLIMLVGAEGLVAAFGPVLVVVAGLIESVGMIAQAMKNLAYNRDADGLARRFAPGARDDDYKAVGRGVAAYNDAYVAQRGDARQRFQEQVETQSESILKGIGSGVTDGAAPRSSVPVNLYIGQDSVAEASMTQDQFARLQSDAAVRTSPPPGWNR